MVDKPFRWTEIEVYRCLSALFAPPAYVWLSQVRNGTGYARSRARTIDALGVSVWPSRGLYFMGVEIKVSKSDWRKELGDGQKAEDIAKYCRYFYVACPRGVIPVGEVPDQWGLIECSERGCAEVTKAAQQLEPTKPDMLLVCSVLRAASAASVPADDVARRIQDAKDAARVGWVPEHGVRDLQESVAAFEETTGLKLPEYDFQSRELGKDVALLRTLKLDGAVAGARQLTKTLEQMLRPLREALDTFQHRQVEEKP